MSRFLLPRSQSPTPSVLAPSSPEWTDDRDYCLSALAAIRKFEVRPVTTFSLMHLAPSSATCGSVSLESGQLKLALISLIAAAFACRTSLKLEV